ncbi:uncharacterized protein LOC142803416 [Rhipicephalus microplus]|uniref:uncharacterized protein LOC142803416 n=1 Tax=Rhipicephalus microplus TaxID=6941 RepID=UPI003F6B1F1D
MRPPDDNSGCPSPEEKLSPRLRRRRLIFTLPGESAAESYCGDSVSHDRQHRGCPVFEARTERSGSRKRSSEFPTSPSSDVLVQSGPKRQRTFDDGHSPVRKRCLVCRFLDLITKCYDCLCAGVLAWLYIKWFV